MILDSRGKLIPFERSQSMKRLFYLLGATLVAGVLLVGVHALYFNYTMQQEQVFKEKVYRTQIEVWSRRMKDNARALSMNIKDVQQRIESYSIQHEIHDTVPPARYERTHYHLTQAIDYYVEAIESAGDTNKARALLSRYDYELKQAIMEYK